MKTEAKEEKNAGLITLASPLKAESDFYFEALNKLLKKESPKHGRKCVYNSDARMYIFGDPAHKHPYYIGSNPLVIRASYGHNGEQEDYTMGFFVFDCKNENSDIVIALRKNNQLDRAAVGGAHIKSWKTNTETLCRKVFPSGIPEDITRKKMESIESTLGANHLANPNCYSPQELTGIIKTYIERQKV